MKRSRAIGHIIKRYRGVRIKKTSKWASTKYKFPTATEASNACWAIHGDTGRECVAYGTTLEMCT